VCPAAPLGVTAYHVPPADKLTLGGIDVYIQAQVSVNVTTTFTVQIPEGSGVPTALTTVGLTVSHVSSIVS
jgi:hypothetical protein